MIQPEWKEELFKYVTGIIQAYDHKLLAINSMPDHIHIFLGMRPTQSLSDLMQDIKGNSSKWINEKKFTNSHFEWQQRYAAFSYSKSAVQNVITYIQNQEIHHRKKTLMEEYIEFLKEFSVSYDEKYLFQDLE